MQYDIFKPISQEEKNLLKNWINLQKKQLSNSKLEGRELIKWQKKELHSFSTGFLDDLPSKFLASATFIRNLVEQKNKMLDGEVILNYVPRILMDDKEFILSVIRHAPFFIGSLAQDHKNDKRILEEALTANGESIQDIEEIFLDGNLVSCAIKSSPKSIEFIPENFLNKELCLEAITKSPKSFCKLPKKFQGDFNFCKLSCNRNIKVWDYLPEPQKFDRHILEFCLSHSGIDGIYDVEDLFMREDFLINLYRIEDRLIRRFILAYCDSELILNFAMKEVKKNSENIQAFIECQRVGKSFILDKIKDKFEL